MRFTTLGSGSSGNATVVEHDGTALLIDCGLSVRELERRASSVDFDLGTVAALLVTHEHADHVGGAGALARRLRVPVYTTRGTGLAAARTLGGVGALHGLEPGRAFAVGPFEVLPVIVPHDAREPCQFVIRTAGLGLGILTDLGRATRHLEHCYQGLDALVLEFNHDPALLDRSAYPRSVQRRIGGDYGHLSNAQARALLARLLHPGLRQVVAAHLSENTNDPGRVYGLLDETLPETVARVVASHATALAWCELDG